MQKVYVYGTLRPGKGLTVDVPGLLYDLGSYPGAVLEGPGFNRSFKAEPVIVDDEMLKRLDAYEGYRPDSPENSLYLRQPFNNGWIYTYNYDLVGRRVIESGDWLLHRGSDAGSAASFFFEAA